MDSQNTFMTADVIVTVDLDEVLVIPRALADRHKLAGALRSAMPGINLRISATGVKMKGEDAINLLVGGNYVDLRWSDEARKFVENRQWVEQSHEMGFKVVGNILKGGKEVAKTFLTDIRGLAPLDDHQCVNVAAMTIPEGYGLCVFDEQGAGKTVTMIFAFDVLVSRDEVDFALIIAPKSMVPEWPKDFEKFMGDLYKVGLITGSRHQKRDTIAMSADVLITNFETAVSMEGELRALLRRYDKRGILVIDESFFIKNLDAKRTRSLRHLREWCGRAFVLCGTPAPNAPQDLIQQFNIVDFGLTFSGVEVPEDREAARLVVQEAIERKGLFVRHLKADVLPDLPMKSFNRILLPLKPIQMRLYEAALNGLRDDLQSTSDQLFQSQITSFLARRIALLQICSNPTSLAPGYIEVPAKLEALDSLLDQVIVQQQEKIIVWSFYTASIDAICARFEQYSPVRYDGTISDVAARREAVRRFQEDDDTMLFVGNPAAAGAGLTLHRARLAVYESMSNQAAHYLQSLDRIHRRGQTREVEYLILLCENTIEVMEYDRLTQKEQAAHLLLGDHVEEAVTRESMLAEVISAMQLLRRQQNEH